MKKEIITIEYNKDVELNPYSAWFVSTRFKLSICVIGKSIKDVKSQIKNTIPKYKLKVSQFKFKYAKTCIE